MIPFAGIRTFLKAPLSTNTTEWTIYGVPFDLGTTFRSGARMGPSAIREASMMLTDGDHPYYSNNPVESGFLSDAGDIEDGLFDSKESYLLSVKKTLDMSGKSILLGGDHLVTLAALRSISKKYDKIGLIHFDAHSDTWFGKSNHGTFVRQAVEEGLINPLSIVQIGIRSPIPNNISKWTTEQGITVISASMIHKNSLEYIFNKININLPIRQVYLTIDIDCLDPSQAPGTGTPEIGGLWSWQILEILHYLNTINIEVVGMDLMEVCPPYDHSGITALAGATFVWDFLCGQLYQSGRWRR